jgi:CHAT domain-containing protein
VRGTTVSGDAVQVIVDASIVKTERGVADPWVASELLPLRMGLLREKDVWVVASVESLDEETAAQLLSAANDELLRELPPGRLPGVARALYERGLALLNAGKFADADRAAVMAQRVAGIAGDRGAEALALGVRMYAVLERDNAAGRQFSRESLALAESVGEPDVLARAWYNRARSIIGDLRLDAKANAERDEAFQRALSFAERAEDATLLVRVLYSMANAAVNVRDHLTARRHVDRFLPLARELGDVTGELSGESVLSLIYFEQEDTERGFYHHARAVRLAKERNAYAYISLILRAGWVLANDYRYDEAREMFARVLTRGPRGEYVAATNVSAGHMATTLMTLAIIEAEAGDLDEASCLLREAARLANQSEASMQMNLADGHLRRRNYRAALTATLTSLAERGGIDYEKIEGLRMAAVAYRALGEHVRAASAVAEAIELRETRNTRIAGDEQQRARGADRTARLYKLAAGIALDLGQPEEALMHLERGRARVLREVLENGRPGALASAEAADIDVRHERERELARLTVELDRARAAGNRDSIRQASDRLDRARAAHATFLDGIRARSESRSLAQPSLRLSEVLQRLPPRVAALSYFASESELHLFVARPDASAIVHRKVAIGRDALADKVQKLVDALSRRDDGFEGIASDLYRLLIAPVEKDLGQAAGVVVVPDGPLWRVTFAALLDPRGRFLIERFPVVYAPSITAWTRMSGDGSRTKHAATSFLGVGNPTLDNAMKTAFVSAYRDVGLGALPDAEREVRQARTAYRQSVVLTGGQASEGRVKQAMPEADVVHLATHALFDDRNPMYSRLAVARDAHDGREDGWLEAWEIMLLPLDADLVVLSACDTATGSIGAGEGVVGMTWAFFVAGARATVSTHWKVSSRGSADLMISFHEALRTREAGPLRKAEALRDAQLRLMRVPRYRHPFYWGAFVMLGDAS